jgi:hypothetical protein
VKQRIRKYRDISAVDFLLQRDELGFKRYRKTAQRDPGKKEILLELGYKKIKEREENDFLIIGYRRRRLKT